MPPPPCPHPSPLFPGLALHPFFSLLARLKTVLKCHVPDPSEFFSQLSSQHGGDLQVGAWDAGVGGVDRQTKDRLQGRDVIR